MTMSDEEVERRTKDAKEAIEYLDEIKKQENEKYSNLNPEELKAQLKEDYDKVFNNVTGENPIQEPTTEKAKESESSSQLSDDKFNELLREYQAGLKALEESKRQFNEKMEGKSEKQIAKYLKKEYNDVYRDAKKSGMQIMVVGSKCDPSIARKLCRHHKKHFRNK